MSIDYKALKRCPVYEPKVNGKDVIYTRTIRMTVCDADQFLSADLYIAGHNLKGDQLNYYARAILISPEYEEWLKQYGISFTATAVILKVVQARLENFAVNIDTTDVKLFVQAYSKEQAEDIAKESINDFITKQRLGPITYTAEHC